jgi:hypothetical protein
LYVVNPSCCHREHPDAKDVHVTGTFDDWSKSVKLDKKGDIFEKTVELPLDKKVLYKVRYLTSYLKALDRLSWIPF